MEELRISYTAIFLATLVHVILGMLWYHSKLFGETWANSLKVSKADAHSSNYIMEILMGFLTAFVLAQLVYWTESFTSWEGAILGLIVAIGFILPDQYSQVIWAKKPHESFFIDVGFHLVQLTLMGALIGMLS